MLTTFFLTVTAAITGTVIVAKQSVWKPEEVFSLSFLCLLRLLIISAYICKSTFVPCFATSTPPRAYVTRIRAAARTKTTEDVDHFAIHGDSPGVRKNVDPDFAQHDTDICIVFLTGGDGDDENSLYSTGLEGFLIKCIRVHPFNERDAHLEEIFDVVDVKFTENIFQRRETSQTFSANSVRLLQ